MSVLVVLCRDAPTCPESLQQALGGISIASVRKEKRPRMPSACLSVHYVDKRKSPLQTCPSDRPWVVQSLKLGQHRTALHPARRVDRLHQIDPPHPLPFTVCFSKT